MFAEQTLCKSRFFKLQDEPVVFVIMKITLRKIIPVPFLFPFEREELAFPLLWLWQGKSFQIKNDDF